MAGKFVPVELLEAEDGDIIEFDRGNYYHYGIYLKKQKHVIHPAKHGNKLSLDKAMIKEEHIREVADLHYVRVNNKETEARMKNFKAYNPEVVVKNAKKEIGELYKYSLLDNNCEMFATKCRYGEGWSDQKEQLRDSVGKMTEYQSQNALGILKRSGPDIIGCASAVIQGLK